LKTNLFRNVLLALFVAVYSLGLFAYSDGRDSLSILLVCQAILNGLLIGQVYFWMQMSAYRGLQLILALFSAILYLWVFQALLPFVWFWLLLLLQVFLTSQYEKGLKWRQIPFLKNILIPLMWFVQLNLIPGFSGNESLLFLVFIVYLALSLQADLDDIHEDAGKLKTVAGILGARNTGFAVDFLLTFTAYLLGLHWFYILIALLIVRKELRMPKGSYDALLLVLGSYFLLR